MILAKGFGAGLLVDTRAGVIELLYLRHRRIRELDIVARGLLLRPQIRIGVRVAMIQGLNSVNDRSNAGNP